MSLLLVSLLMLHYYSHRPFGGASLGVEQLVLWGSVIPHSFHASIPYGNATSTHLSFIYPVLPIQLPANAPGR